MSLTVIRKIFSLLFFLAGSLIILMSSCSDKFLYGDTDKCPEGLPATVTVPVSTTDMPRLTRADMQPGVDAEVTSIAVAIYNVASGRRTGYMKLDDPEQPGLDHDKRNIKLSTLSGTSYIVAVANYKSRYASVDNQVSGEGGQGNLVGLESAIDEADTWEKFCEISVAFDSHGGISTEAPRNPLVMCGSYYSDSPEHSDGSMTAIEAVDIYPESSTLNGAIHLRRLISQVKFNVTYNTETIKSFRIKSWRVANLPVHSWLLEHEPDNTAILEGVNADVRNAVDVRTANGNKLYDTPSYTDMSVDGNTVSFDFWQVENKRVGRDVSSELEYDSAAPYNFREKEYKNSDGSNSGKYVSLVNSISSTDPNNDATYVVISVSMEMSKDTDGGSLASTNARRLVEADYLVHLGYVEGSDEKSKAMDFRCRRNSKYTYNVKINNVDNIKVEAHVENEGCRENSPGVEGFISDLTSNFYQVDAHYSAVNIYLSETELKNFNFYVSATRLDGSDVFINSIDGSANIPAEGSRDYKYMSWVEFRKLDSDNGPDKMPSNLALYKPRLASSENSTYTLADLKKQGSTLIPGWYTMFINEYVYEDGDGDESNFTNWHGYVNRPDRRVWIYVQIHKSEDGNSIHYDSKYSLSQSSIQTYYANNLSNKSGLGIEHVNESYGLNLRNTYNPQGNGNPNSGRYNTAYYLSGKKWTENGKFSWEDGKYDWDKFLNLTESQKINSISNQGVSRAGRTEPLPAIKQTSTSKDSYDPDQDSNPKCIEVIMACMNRNRDNNGDGKIDASELRWFVPTTKQYIRMILGRRSLVDPIVDADVVEKLPDANNGNNSLLLYATSDGKQIWAMEGTSISNWREYSSKAPWEVRCVRNLGGNQTIINEGNVTQPAFYRRTGTNIIDLSRYDQMSIRSEAYNSSDNPMPVHNLYDQNFNRCYKAFEFADSQYDISYNDIKDDITTNGGKVEWAAYLNGHNPCKGLVEKTKKDGWRVPNQKELTILATLGLQPGFYVSYTCTMSYFDKKGYAYGKYPNPADGLFDYDHRYSFDFTHRYVMKVAGYTGNGTQGEDGTTSFGIRCVRDYVE